MADSLISAVTATAQGFYSDVKTDNVVDRWSRLYSVILLICLACLVTSKQLVGSPIECWCPAQFTDSHVRYTNSYCWVSSTNYLPSEQVIPHSFAKDSKITYYQWIPLVFLLQSVVCHLPCLLWRLFLCQTGANVASLMEASVLASKAIHLELRQKAICHVAAQFDRYTCTQRYNNSSCYHRVMNALSRKCFVFGGRNFGNSLANSYLLVKVAYACNAILQIHMIDSFLGKDYYFYGIHAVHGFLQRINWPGPEHFPTTTLCEIEIRDQSRMHNYIVQCVLSINIFNEKIFIFLWFWFTGLLFLTSLDLLRWLAINFYWRGAIRYVSKQLKCCGTGEANYFDPVLLSRFVKNYLRRDGLIILRLVAGNYGNVLTGEILDQLWTCYLPPTTSGNTKKLKKKTTKVSLQESNSTSQLL